MKLLKNRFATIYYVTLLLSACGGNFQSSSQGHSALPSIQGAKIHPETDRLDSHCETSLAYDACIFYKSPTHQLGQVFISKTEVSSQRHWGVKLTGLDDSGNLSSEYLEVRSVAKEHIKTAETIADVNTEALMSYYWAQKAFEFYESQADGLFKSSYKKLTIIIDDTTSGFRSSTNTIYLSQAKDRLPMALDATLLLHYLGQANVYWASKGEVRNFDQDVSHRTCAGDPKGCCSSINGCSSALMSGSADYLALSLFPEAASISNTWSKNIEGQNLCGVSRSMVQARQLHVGTSFEKCSEELKGQTHLMGLLYASIWWEVRLQVEELGTGEVPYIDRLFQAHLKELKGHHDFTDALEIILKIDQNLHKGRFSHFFTTEFRRRGL